jgi:hypothetical protein
MHVIGAEYEVTRWRQLATMALGRFTNAFHEFSE